MNLASARPVVPALLLAWCALVAWACLPALEGPPPLAYIADSPALEPLLPIAESRQQKILGLALHLLSGCLVYLLCVRLFAKSGAPRADWPAWAVAALWLSLPLLMGAAVHAAYMPTVLRGALALTALLAYCRGREAMVDARLGWPWLAACFVGAVLAGLSLGNVLFLVPMLALVEVFVFRFRGLNFGEQRMTYAALVLIAVPMLGVLAWQPGVVTDGHTLREISGAERAFAFIRILFDYTAQILWVDVRGLGLYHDNVAALQQRWAVTAAAAAAGLLLLACIVYATVSGRGRLPALGLSLFLAGQVMESGAVPQELYSEPRNYLPSFGLLLALVSAATALQQRWPITRGWPALVLAILLSRNLLLLGSQAVVWSDDYLLHMDAANSHPESRRTQLELAYRLARDGNLEGALRRIAADEATAETVLLGALFYCLADRPFPDRHFSQVSPSATVLEQAPLKLYAAHVSRRMLAGECAEGDAARFDEAMGEWAAGW